MFKDIKNKRVLVTGASGGIGSSIAKLFASHGAVVGIHYDKAKDKAESILKEIKEKGGKAELIQGNLLDQNVRKCVINDFVDKCGRIDVLINNAGACFDYIDLKELSQESWDKTFDLNVKAPFYLIGSALKHMKQGGRIINISSVNAKYGGSSKSIHYAASKAALDSLTVGFAREGAKNNILVNSIRCGLIDTRMRDNVEGYSDEQFRKRIEMIPLKRAGKPIDIARMALFLASECGDFITGEIFAVAGGD